MKKKKLEKKSVWGPGFSRCFALAGLVAATAVGRAMAAPNTGAPVSRAEYEALKTELKRVNERLGLVDRAGQGKPGSVGASSTGPAKSAVLSDEALNTSTFGRQIQGQIDSVKQGLRDLSVGSGNFLLVGNAQSSLEIPRHGGSTFGASISPIMLWTISPNLFVESELELELDGSETTTKLEYAQILYNLNDYVTFGAGKFLDPMNVFVERYEPKWINKLPDTPLGIYDGFLPESIVGAQVRGAVPLASEFKVLYSLFTGNGGKLVTDNADGIGTVNFDNFTDNNAGKAVGGRVGLLSFRNVEIGYGFEYAKVGDRQTPFKGVDSLVQSADMDYIVEDDAIAGRFNLRGQYAWSKISNATYDADNALGIGPLNFSNKRNGGYIQASYRPTKAGCKVLRSLEFISRWDKLNLPSGLPGSIDEQRITLGVDYWLRANTALKLAYQLDNQKGAQDNNKMLFQVVTGLF